MSADRDRLLELLRGLGATDEQLRDIPDERLGAFAVDLAVGGGRGEPFADAAARAGVDVDVAAGVWQALGFPDPRTSTVLVAPEERQALTLLGDAAIQMFGVETTHALARVISATTARMAEAIIDAFRVRVELPQRVSGTDYAEIVEGFTALIPATMPPLLETIGMCLRRNLVMAAAGSWSTDEDNSLTSKDLVVGFVDLAGFTALSRSLAAGPMAQLVERFERHVAVEAAARGVRVVKLLGDGAMVIADDAGSACGFATALVAALSADPALPPVRVGLAAGPVVLRSGDYYGDVVNLAARLVAAAPADGTLVSEEVRRTATSAAFGELIEHELPGFDEPVRAAVLAP